MKFPRVVESWLYNDPGEIVDRLIQRSERAARRASSTLTAPRGVARRDRYYTAARRIHVKRLMRGMA